MTSRRTPGCMGCFYGVQNRNGHLITCKAAEELVWGPQKRRGASIVTRSTVAKILRAADSFSPGARVASARVTKKKKKNAARKVASDYLRWKAVKAAIVAAGGEIPKAGGKGYRVKLAKKFGVLIPEVSQPE